MYRNIGYYVASQASVIIPAAKQLLGAIGASKIEREVAEAFRQTGYSDRRFMKDFTEMDPLQISKSDLFNEAKGENYRNMLWMMYTINAASGWGDHRPTKLKYTENPLMTLDEILADCLQDHLDKALQEIGAMWPEKTNMELYRTHLGALIKRIAHIDAYRSFIADKLERYIGDLTYRMKIGEISANSLDQFDRTLLVHTIYKQTPDLLKWTDENGNSHTLNVRIDQKDSDPLIAPEIARIKNVVKPGPWMRYTTLVSNADQRELMFLLSPVANELTTVTGYMVPIGPFFETHLDVAHRIPWGTAEQFSGFIENVQFPQPQTAAQRGYGFRNPAFRLQVLPPNPDPKSGKQYTERWYQPATPSFDYPTLDIINDSDAQGQPDLKFSWYSPTKQVMVHTSAGATVNTMLLDLALTNTQAGESAVDFLNIQDFKFVDLTDDSMADRRIVADAKTSFDDAPHLRNRIYEDIFYFEGGKTLKKMENVDVTFLTNKLGNVTFRPALSRFFIPSIAWFSQPDSTAVDFIIGKLGLGKYDAMRSKLAITMSHNAAVYKRVTGNEKVPFDLEKRIKALHNIEYTVSVPTQKAKN